MQRNSRAQRTVSPHDAAPIVATTPATPPTQQDLSAASLASIVGYKELERLRALGDVQGLAQMLNSKLDYGVEDSTVTSRAQQFGTNELPPMTLDTFWDYVKEALMDKTMLILIGAAVVSLILGMTTKDPRTGEVDRETGWIEGAAILVSVVIVVLVSAINNYQKQLKFAELSQAAPPMDVLVLRSGRLLEIHNTAVVVGDIVVVHGGMSLTFDAVLVDGHSSVACDESPLTGEPQEVHKSITEDPFLISGTNVLEASDSLALVVAVGTSSCAGTIAMAVRTSEKVDTPLEVQLNDVAEQIGRYGLIAAIITFVVLAAKETANIYLYNATFYSMKYFENLTTAVAIVVVAVPEGLPLSVTLSLAYSMKRMLQDKNLVRHLAACETMGGATTICSDKTGTLTTSDMAVRRLYIHHPATPITEISATADVARDAVKNVVRSMSPNVLRTFCDAIAFNCSTAIRNKTADALQSLCQRMEESLSYSATARAANTDKHAVKRFAFTSLRKMQSTAVLAAGPDGSTVMYTYVMGAAEVILARCTMLLSPTDGKKISMNADARRDAEHHLRDFASSGLRTICVAYAERPIHRADFPPTKEVEDNLVMLGVVGIEEPLRQEVPEAVRVCRAGGINVIMITGDNVHTAVSIALSCNIVSQDEVEPTSPGTAAARGFVPQLPRYVAIDGPEFRAMSDADALDLLLPKIKVLARATPLDKQRLVRLIQMNPAEVVAVTGDGTNDAPSLKSAHVGFAMFSGTDIAKNASDIVLMDDNFVGVVKAVMWGRNVKDNIRKFLQFQLTVNIVACLVAFIGALINSMNLSPLKPVQLLWLNLIMDTLAALALATELPNASLLNRFPEPKTAPIITKNMWTAIKVQTVFQLVTGSFLLLFAAGHLGIPYFGLEHLTIVFNTFVLMQVFNFFNARHLDAELNTFKNLSSQSYVLMYIVFIIVLTQAFIVQAGGKFMATTPLTMGEWAFCTMVGAVTLPLGVAMRMQMAKNAGQSGLGGVAYSRIPPRIETV